MYSEKKINTRGGKREGSGRKRTGRSRRVYYLTDDENQRVKQFIEEMRKTKIIVISEEGLHGA